MKSREKLITDAYYKEGLSFEEISKKLKKSSLNGEESLKWNRTFLMIDRYRKYIRNPNCMKHALKCMKHALMH